jgi:hypothetical protein
MKSFYAQVCDVRVAQDRQWGGPKHDDSLTRGDWIRKIEKQLGKMLTQPGKSALHIAALCFAMMESIQRMKLQMKNPCGEIAIGESQEMSREWQHALMHKIGTPHDCAQFGTPAPGMLTEEQYAELTKLFGGRRISVFDEKGIGRAAGQQTIFGRMYGGNLRETAKKVAEFLSAIKPEPELIVVDTNEVG